MISLILKKIRTRFPHCFQPPNPKDYSATLGLGSTVPVQVEAYFLALNRYIKENYRVLDVGFGLGYGLIILSISAREVSGIDVDEKSYTYCHSTMVGKNPKLKFIGLYNGEKLPFDDDFFDVLTCIDVIEHVDKYDALIEEMLRVSKHGVFISTPNKRPEYTNPDGTPKNYWHLREWSGVEFKKITQNHGICTFHFINGPWEGPFQITDTENMSTLALSVFIKKEHPL